MASSILGRSPEGPIAVGPPPLVRRATEKDVPSLARVHLDTVLVAYAGFFPAHAPTPSFEELVTEWDEAFADPSFRAFLAEEDGSAVGTVAIRADREAPGGGQLRRLHVLPGRWGLRLGSALYEAALEALRTDGYPEAGLWVLEANSRARRFYEDRGWSLVPGRVLEWPGLNTIEVRYRLALTDPHPERVGQ